MNYKRGRTWVSCLGVLVVCVIVFCLLSNFVYERCASLIPHIVGEDGGIGCYQPSTGNLVLPGGSNRTCHLVPDRVYDLRIMVLTYNRPASLLEILYSLTNLEMDGDSVLLEIWIDRSKKGKVDMETLNRARSFRWKHSPVHVYVQEKHAGIIGQWLYTWNPKVKTPSIASSSSSSSSTSPPGDSNPDYEIGLILEDDLSLSPYAYRWLKAARGHFRGRRDVAGITLQSEGLIVAQSGRPFDPSPVDTGPSYLYKLVGSWGFAPDPLVWIEFREWYARRGDLKPYVSGLLMTKWYKSFERKRVSDSMWTMWFIYYCHKKDLYVVYSNLVHSDRYYAFLPNLKNVAVDRNSILPAVPARTRPRACLALNRREPGLHFSARVNVSRSCMEWSWRPEYVQFGREQVRYGFNGKRVR